MKTVTQYVLMLFLFVAMLLFMPIIYGPYVTRQVTDLFNRSQQERKITLPVDSDPRGIFAAQGLVYYADCIAENRECARNDKTTLQLFLEYMEEVDNYNLKPKDIDKNFSYAIWLRQALRRARVTYPEYRIYAEWKPYYGPMARFVGDGGVKIWILQSREEAPEERLWRRNLVFVHLPKEEAENEIRTVLGAQSQRPYGNFLETKNEESFMDVTVNAQIFWGRDSNGEVIVYGGSRPVIQEKKLWDEFRKLNPEVVGVELKSRTVVLRVSRKIQSPLKREETSLPESSPVADSWLYGVRFSEDFDMREFSATVKQLNLSPIKLNMQKR